MRTRGEVAALRQERSTRANPLDLIRGWKEGTRRFKKMPTGGGASEYDAQFRGVFDAIRQLMAPPAKAPRSIGFRVEEGRPV